MFFQRWPKCHTNSQPFQMKPLHPSPPDFSYDLNKLAYSLGRKKDQSQPQELTMYSVITESARNLLGKWQIDQDCELSCNALVKI